MDNAEVAQVLQQLFTKLDLMQSSAQRVEQLQVRLHVYYGATMTHHTRASIQAAEAYQA